MYENIGYVMFGASAVIALIAVSGIYPARRLFLQRTPKASRSLWAVVGLALATPLAVLAIYQFRLSSMNHPDARALQMMPVTLGDLPILYLLSVSVAAILLWLLLALNQRTAA